MAVQSLLSSVSGCAESRRASKVKSTKMVVLDLSADMAAKADSGAQLTVLSETPFESEVRRT